MATSECLPRIFSEQTHDPEQRADLRAESYAIAQPPLLALIRDFYNHIDDELFTLAKKSDNNALQSLYFDAMREIRLKRMGFKSLFSEQLAIHYDVSCQPSRGGEGSQVESFVSAEDGVKVLGQDELEEQVAISNLQSKLDDRFKEVLIALACRYRYLLANDGLSLEQLPLSPKAICKTFQTAFGVFDISLRVKLILYKLLDKHMVQNLQKVYSGVDQFLLEQAVLPDYVVDASVNVGSQREQLEDDSALVSDADTSFGQLCQLLNLRRKSVGEYKDGSGATAIQPYSTEDICCALSQLQSEGGINPSLGDSLREVLQRNLAGLADGVLSTDDCNTIDLVAIIFDFIYDDQELSSDLKLIVARLQIPMLKVAVLDKKFFSDQHYPARVLLNEFTQTGFASGDNNVEEKIESLVNRIVTEFNDDIELFSDVLNEFRDFLFSEQQLFLDQQQVQLREAELQERRACAAKCVDKEIGRCIPDAGLPELLQVFIDEVWGSLLINTYLEEGEGSQAWKIHIQLTEDLLWSLTPKNSPGEKNYLANMIPHLIRVLEDCLVETTWEKLKVDTLFNELSDQHIIALRGESSNAEQFSQPEPQAEEVVSCELHQKLLKELQEVEHEEVILDGSGVHSQIRNATVENSLQGAASDLPELDEMSGMSDIEEEKDKADGDYYDERVAGMQLGDWVEFSDDGENLLKVKLIWRGESDGRLIFANWQNEVVRRCKDWQLAEKLRCWDARILNTAPIMERALSSVMGVLGERGRDVTAA